MGFTSIFEELSAAVTMELLYFYALAHQTSFDVRWLRKGTVSGSLMRLGHSSERPRNGLETRPLRSPLLEHLSQKHGLTLRSECFVQGLELEEDRVRHLRLATGERLEELDAVVLALGAGGLRNVLRGSPEVARRCTQLSATTHRMQDGVL